LLEKHKTGDNNKMTDETQNQEREARKKAKRKADETTREMIIGVTGISALAGMFLFGLSDVMGMPEIRDREFWEKEARPLCALIEARYDKDGNRKIEGAESRALARAVGYEGALPGNSVRFAPRIRNRFFYRARDVVLETTNKKGEKSYVEKGISLSKLKDIVKRPQHR
jgi:hypothetical protein